MALLLSVCLISSDIMSLIYQREVDGGRKRPDFSTSTIDDASLSVISFFTAGPRLWNSLPDSSCLIPGREDTVLKTQVGKPSY